MRGCSCSRRDPRRPRARSRAAARSGSARSRDGASWTRLRVPKRSVSRAGSLTQIRSGLRWTIRSLGCRVSAANGSDDRRRCDRIGRLDDRLVHAVDEPADPLGAVPVDLLRHPPRAAPANGVATHLPFFRIRSRTSAGAASANLNEIWSARPSAFGENARRVTAALPSVRVTASCVGRGRDAAAGRVRGELDPEDPVRQAAPGRSGARARRPASRSSGRRRPGRRARRGRAPPRSRACSTCR